METAGFARDFDSARAGSCPESWTSRSLCWTKAFVPLQQPSHRTYVRKLGGADTHGGDLPMKARTLEGLRVAILATDGVEQSELTEPRKALDEAGATIMLIAPKAGHIQAMKHDEKADRFPVDGTLDDVDADDF